jgi:hypothetical protein
VKRHNLLKYLVAVAVDQPRKAIDNLLRDFDASSERLPQEELEQLFRQLTPDADELDSHGAAGDLVSNVHAQWRLAIEHGYRPPGQSLPILRGVTGLSQCVQSMAPGSDALIEGLKDYRLTRLLGEVQAMLEPVHWLGQLDKILALVISSPRILDDAIAAVVPDRAVAERRVAPSRGRESNPATWIIPAIAALLAVGLCRGPAGIMGSTTWGEAPLAVLFLLFGCWLVWSIVATRA